MFFPGDLVARARVNARDHAWAAEIRDSVVAAAQPWMDLSDDDLWRLMFGNSIRRSWQVWSDGHCPACRKPVPMYEWVPDAMNEPWKMRCPQCRELFPKNDFRKFYGSGLNDQGVFDPNRADRSLLFNAEHPDASDPLHEFGVDDGEGYTEDGKRWRFIGAYLIFGQWKQAIVGGIRNLAAAYVVTGDITYAHKAGLLLDRVADLYPTFDFGKEGVMYEGAPRSGYVSTWHDACVEVHDLALAYDAIFDGLARDTDLVEFLAAKAAELQLANPKTSFADIQRNIEERIFRDTLAHRPKIESNYPATDVTITTLETVLGWPRQRAGVEARLDRMIDRATAVDGVTGEKGIAGYTAIAPRAVAQVLGRYERAEPGFIREAVRRHPRLHAMYRFHLDTWCLGQYYPRTGDTGGVAARTPHYAGLAFSKNPSVQPSSYAFLWELYEATGDADFVRLLYLENDSSTDGLPFDLFATDPEALQAKVAGVIAQQGAEIQLTSVNKAEWNLAILRSGEGVDARAVWLDYDSGERHGHADGMSIGLFAKGFDLLPDFGYPPVQYGGWNSPRAVWYTQTAAHNTIGIDGQNTRTGSGKPTLWLDGVGCRVMRASGPKLMGGQRYERMIVLLDICERDCYLIDIFRVVGGREHTRFFHGHFGQVTTEGLSLVPSEQPHFHAVMRDFQRDSAPSEGWSVDWKIQDRLKFQSSFRDVHLRLRDLTHGAEVQLARTWVSVGLFDGTDEAWIPSVLVHRRAAESPLHSTFVGVLEPYEGTSNIAAVRRLKLQDSVQDPLPDGHVGVEVRLADGGRDIILSTDGEVQSPPDVSPSVVDHESGVRFEGDLCLIRFQSPTSPTRVLFCRGRSLRVGDLVVRAKHEDASFEIDLKNKDAPIVAGSAEAVELIEVAGARIWPK